MMVVDQQHTSAGSYLDDEQSALVDDPAAEEEVDMMVEDQHISAAICSRRSARGSDRFIYFFISHYISVSLAPIDLFNILYKHCLL